MADTVIVTLCDRNYLGQAIQTISDVRGAGQYAGDLALVAIDFHPPAQLIEKYKLIVRECQAIDTTELVARLKERPFTGGDGRERSKLSQWNKLYMFDSYFSRWRRVIFMDAGFRVFDRIDHFLAVPWEGKLTALDDSHPEGEKRFGCQLEQTARPDSLRELQEFWPGCLTARYFLNCFWIHDTAIVRESTFSELVSLMNRFPICRTNEMGAMNIYFTGWKRLWQPLDIRMPDGRMLMDWSERDGRTWRDYVSLKYPTTKR